ncbi:glycosyltransferase [bacterium]|nr:glycosyltransferase [bacterium]MBT4598357.1 glycosyltransferase [bacterium]MBT7038039.1 glycosyltransferase [bacterium]MBT7431549.1 glycosyltransferase [bacterium]
MQKTSKLIMTILARDEGDIIKQNIEFHLSHGVDFIIATDNASIDNTRDVFLEYQKKGKLFLIDEPGRNKSQAAWNNRMAKIAIEDFGADIIFHCDADEFWSPIIGNLKTELINCSADVLEINLVNVLLEDRAGKEVFPEDVKYAVEKPLKTENFREDSREKNLYFFRYPQKVMMKTNCGMLEVAQGNHSITNNGNNIVKKTSSNINIFHFPLRGKERFFKKVIETGKAVEKNQFLNSSQSWHIRRWYKAYKKGKLDIEYKKLVITKKEADEMKNNGVVVDFIFNNFFKKKMNWTYNKTKFDYEKKLNDIGWPWAGHKYFAYDLVCNVRPKRIVELGTFYGTSLWSFSQAIKDNNLDTELFGVDTWKGEAHSGFYGEEVFETVSKVRSEFYPGLNINLLRKTFDEAVYDFKDESIDILHIDGLHTYEAVKHDFETWLPKVRKDGIILFHDIKVGRDGFGVYKFWEELTGEYLTIEFFHSYGLGVLFLSRDNENYIKKIEKKLQMKYSDTYESVRKVFTNKKDLEIKEKTKEFLKIEREINLLKKSKFWKLRERYMKLKNFRFNHLLELCSKGSSILRERGIKIFISYLFLYLKKGRKGFSSQGHVFSKKNILRFPSSPSSVLPEKVFFAKKEAIKNMVDIIIVRFNNKEIEDKAISMVKKNTKHPYKLTIYDNFKNNEGLSTVWNRLIGKSDCKYICLLNTDAFVTEGWLEEMMKGFTIDDRVVGVSPASNNAKGQICKQAEIITNRFLEMNTLSGFCLLIKKEPTLKFPEEIPFYGGEHAWCINARRNGYKLLWAQGSWVEHLGESSAKKNGNLESLWSKRNEQFFNWLAKTTPVLFTTYNRLDYTKETLPKLLDSICGKVIVVDNASNDGTKEYLKSLNSEKLELIFHSENTAITGSMNTFLNKTKNEEFIGKVDNDTIVKGDWLVRMLELAIRHDVDAMQAKHDIWNERFNSFNEWMKSLQKIGDHVFFSEYIGGSGVVIKRSSITDEIPGTKWALGGWSRYQREHPELRTAFCNNVEVKLLDMDGDNTPCYEKYKDYYKETGRS